MGIRIISQPDSTVNAFEDEKGIKIKKWILLLHNGWGFTVLCMRRKRDMKSLVIYLNLKKLWYNWHWQKMRWQFMGSDFQGKKKKILRKISNKISGKSWRRYGNKDFYFHNANLIEQEIFLWCIGCLFNVWNVMLSIYNILIYNLNFVMEEV